MSRLRVLIFYNKIVSACDRGEENRGTANYGARELHVCRNVLVIGKGKPHHVTEARATKWVHTGKAVWQKQGRRVKYTVGKHSRPEVRDLSCFVDEDVVIALRAHDNEERDLARVFVSQTQRKRERVKRAA